MVRWAAVARLMGLCATMSPFDHQMGRCVPFDGQPDCCVPFDGYMDVCDDVGDVGDHDCKGQRDGESWGLGLPGGGVGGPADFVICALVCGAFFEGKMGTPSMSAIRIGRDRG